MVSGKHKPFISFAKAIFIDINLEENVDKLLKDKVKQEFFDKVFFRANEIRKERPDLNARIYSGFEYSMDNMEFYIKNGFEEDYSIIMEANINENFKYTLSEEVEVVQINLEVEEELIEYRHMYDEIFISPLDTYELIEQSKEKCFNSLYFTVALSLTISNLQNLGKGLIYNKICNILYKSIYCTVSEKIDEIMKGLGTCKV